MKVINMSGIKTINLIEEFAVKDIIFIPANVNHPKAQPTVSDIDRVIGAGGDGYTFRFDYNSYKVKTTESKSSDLKDKYKVFLLAEVAIIYKDDSKETIKVKDLQKIKNQFLNNKDLKFLILE